MFLYYFMLFFIYSVLGWTIETINCSIISKKKVLNRGFLFGPYCPVYGFASVIMIICLSEYRDNPFNLFIMAVVYCSLLEYFTSWIMEKIFNARWWDYSTAKYNLKGRICLKNCMLFGLLGILLIYIINPFVNFIIDNIPIKLFNIVSIVILFIFLFDFIFTLFILSRLNLNIKNINSDATQDIDEQTKKLLNRYKKSYKRIFKAFPKVRYNTDIANKLISEIRKSLDEIDKKRKEKRNEIKKVKKEIKNLKEKKLNTELKNKKNELKEIRRKKIK